MKFFLKLYFLFHPGWQTGNRNYRKNNQCKNLLYCLLRTIKEILPRTFQFFCLLIFYFYIRFCILSRQCSRYVFETFSKTSIQYTFLFFIIALFERNCQVLEYELKTSLYYTKVCAFDLFDMRAGDEVAIIQFDSNVFIDIVIQSEGEVFLCSAFYSGIIQREIIETGT